MKNLLATFLFVLVSQAVTVAQQTVGASEIIEKINRKEAVSYQNVIITGDLDLTNLANRREMREGNQLSGTQEFLSVVNVPMSFKKCVFKGKVLAYRSEDKDRKLLKISNVIYNTNFTEAVTIEDCTFEQEAAFKYSTFDERAIFTGNVFRDYALFKYTKFQQTADFSNSTFRGEADFKYTKFSEPSFFRHTAFDKSADFKYTKFNERVDFSQARFDSHADFKYTKLPRGTRFDNTYFDSSSDFKYTTLDGRKFSPNQ